MKRTFYIWLFPVLLLYGAFSEPRFSKIQRSSNFQLDTNIILYDYITKEAFHYYQYLKLLQGGEYVLFGTHYDGDGTVFIGDKHYIIKMPPPPPGMLSMKAIKPDSITVVKRLEKFLSRPEKKSLAGIDTTLLVNDEKGNALRFHEYFKLMNTGRYTIILDSGKRSLQLNPGMKVMDEISINNKIYFSLTRADKILVKKGIRKMYLLRGRKVIFEFPVNLGKYPLGPKQKEGDGRTPEGLYNWMGGSTYDPDYYMGYVISYPNAKDVANAKKNHVSPGGQIMIHGTSPAKSKLKDWTNGCIAISNANMDILDKYISKAIPIEILQ